MSCISCNSNADVKCCNCPVGERGPTGLPGVPGGVGPQGPYGPAGPQGNTGIEGPQGPPGLTGGPGLTGPQGTQGVKGDKGDHAPPNDPGCGINVSGVFGETISVNRSDLIGSTPTSSIEAGPATCDLQVKVDGVTVTRNSVGALQAESILNTFDSVALLQSETGLVADPLSNVINSGHAFTLGYYANSNLGGGTFLWDPNSVESEVQGLIVKAQGVTVGRWVRQWDKPTLDLSWVGLAESNLASVNVSVINLGLSLADTVIVPSGIFKVDSQISVSAFKHLTSNGKTAGTQTELLATGSFESVVNIHSYSELSNIRVNAAFKAKHCITMDAAAIAVLTDVKTSFALRDGIHMYNNNPNGVHSNNNAVTMTNCYHEQCGQLQGSSVGMAYFNFPASQKFIVAGTVALTAGSGTTDLIGTGTSFTTLGLRQGDPIRVSSGSNVYVSQVAVVVSDTKIIMDRFGLPLVPFSAPVADWVIGSGCGVYQEISSDNNVALITNPISNSCAAFGHHMQGLYGSTFNGGIWEGMGFGGVCIGNNDNTVFPFTTTMTHPYFESDDHVAQIWERSGIGLTIIEPLMRALSDPQAFFFGHPQTSKGTLISNGRVLPLPISNIWPSQTGAILRTNINSASITLIQLAEHVAALVSDLKYAGPLY
jgi:Collagen triple helix repeat (20 copies)